MLQLVEDFNEFFINRVNGIHAGLSTPATSTYTTEERQLPRDFEEFQSPLDTSVNDVVMSLSSETYGHLILVTMLFWFSLIS